MANEKLGEGFGQTAIKEFNEGGRDLISLAFREIFKLLRSKAKEIPQAVEDVLNSIEMRKNIETAWAKQLGEKGLIPEGYTGLPENLLISNLHQDGYLDGIYTGYALSMMAMVDSNISRDEILSVRDAVTPNLIGKYYKNAGEYIRPFKEDEGYNWITMKNQEEQKAIQDNQYLEYWRGFFQYCANHGREDIILGRKTPKDGRFIASSGIKEFVYIVTIPYKKSLNIGVHAYGHADEFEQLLEKKEKIEDILGQKLDWNSNKENSIEKDVFLRTGQKPEFDNKKAEEQYAYIVERIDLFRKALRQVGWDVK